MDPVETALQTIYDKVGIYGAACVAIAVLCLAIMLGIKYLWAGERGGKHHSSRPYVGKAWR